MSQSPEGNIHFPGKASGSADPQLSGQSNSANEDGVQTPLEAEGSRHPSDVMDAGRDDSFQLSAKELVAPPTSVPWLVGLFLLTSTMVQNQSYVMVTFAFEGYFGWSDKQRTQFSQLCFNMIYLGPLFGLIVDLVRVRSERFRPVIIVASVVNAVVCFVCFGKKNVQFAYGSILVLTWLMEVMTMFMYMPMNAVVIKYGNSALESADESSARIGGLMAQAMVWRTLGTVLQSIFYNLAKSHMSNRWMMLVAAIASCVLVVQVIFLMKQWYFVDKREANFKHTTPMRFYKSMLNVVIRSVKRHRKARGTAFMFVLCFTFIYFMVPDALYTYYYTYNVKMSKQLAEANSILSSVGALLGAFLYALWMYLAYVRERRKGRVVQTNPVVVCFAGCAAWSFATFFHMIGYFGTQHASFSYEVFIPFQTVVTQACLRFAFMPTLSLVAMHAPAFYETATFALFSVATTGGGAVSSTITLSMFQSMGASTVSGYWKGLLVCMAMQFLPMVIAVTLPKSRSSEDTDIDVILEEYPEHEPLAVQP